MCVRLVESNGVHRRTSTVFSSRFFQFLLFFLPVSTPPCSEPEAPLTPTTILSMPLPLPLPRALLMPPPFILPPFLASPEHRARCTQVGYQVRMQRSITEDTQVLFCTTGILLRR